MSTINASIGPSAQRTPAQEHALPRRRVALSESIVCGLVGLADALAIIVISLAIYLSYVGWTADAYDRYLAGTFVQVILTISLLRNGGLYEFSAIVSWPSRIRQIIALIGLVGLMMIGVGYALKISHDFSRAWFFGTMGAGATAIILQRGVARLMIQRMGHNSVLTRSIAIVGAGGQAHHLIGNLLRQQAPWKRVVGIFDDRKTRVPAEIDGIPVLGTLDDLVTIVRSGEIDDVVITLPWSADERLVDIIHRLRALPVHIYLGSDLIGYHFPRHRPHFLQGVPVVHIASAPLTGWSGLVKTLEDKVVASSVLFLFAPIMLLIAIAIRLDSPGPVLFRQKRYGFNNQLIEVWKFRSMYHHLRDENADTLVGRSDPRVTRIGAFLRRTSLDELPQLFNVLRGDMSVVGPRPHAVKAKAAGRLYEEIVEDYAVRHKVKPGLTGWAQVSGWRGETLNEEDIRKRVEHDLFYIENWSLWLDLKILLMTAFIGWSGKRAY
jgi:Undecaprenyl-phosphate glucose phosphotransferase